ncbi:MAG: AAA family ATPase [Lachnospiraceae bacterium]|nr:AAA family ATPase [Lachnospiraceae bacterium]
MNQTETIERIHELEREIAALAPGSIVTKKIKGKEYFYHRIDRDKKRTETYVPFDKAADLHAQIQKRKSLEAELKALKRTIPAETPAKKADLHSFHAYVRTGEQLKSYASPVKRYKKRECYAQLHEFVFGEQQDKVFILYGLRRTGKTTLIRQIFLEMTAEQLLKSAFIQVHSGNSLSEINSDLKYLESEGCQYVFIDEVTLMEDFIEGAALFSDIYASSGMKIVLSGTDSLGFIFTEDDQLYDRCIMLHTTFIPYREFENVLGIKGIDEYIRYGGTMSMGGVNYNKASSFATKESADEYIDSAIARNIQHSLRYYQDGGHFRHLYDLYQKGELTSAINRVVEDINHKFTKDVMTRAFHSGDLSLSARNLLHDRTAPVDLMEHIDRDTVESLIMDMLDILNKEDQSVEIDEAHAYQIKEYLTLLDLIMEVDLLHLPNVNLREKITIISQPGMRYAQAEALVSSLLQDEKFSSLSIIERNQILERILSEIKGRMMEDIILLETSLAFPDRQVFQLQFAIGEFDMVIFDPATLSCEIFEIKYSKEVIPNQYRHLINQEKLADTEHRFGKITGRYVIYRGERTQTEGIKYLNVEEYLKSLTDEPDDTFSGRL